MLTNLVTGCLPSSLRVTDGSIAFGNYRATDWIRTNDLRFTKPLLYQLSYGGLAFALERAAKLVA